MLGKSLGIDIHDDMVSAVLVKKGVQEQQIIACASAPILGGNLANALRELFEQVNTGGASIASTLPSDRLFFRNLVMPFSDRKKIRQTLPFELEEQLPIGIEEVIVDFNIIGHTENETRILAAVTPRTVLQDYLDSLTPFDVEPENIGIRAVPLTQCLIKHAEIPTDGIVLDIRSSRSTMVLYLAGQIVLIRTLPFGQQVFSSSDPGNSNKETETGLAKLQSLCRQIHSTLNAFGFETGISVRPKVVFICCRTSLSPAAAATFKEVLQLPAEQVDLCSQAGIKLDRASVERWNPALMDNALAIALVGRSSNFNFRQEEFSVKRQYLRIQQEFRGIAVMAAVVLLLLTASVLLEYHTLQKKYNAVNSQLVSIFKETFPEVTKVIDPLQQMQIKINELKENSAVHPGMQGNGHIINLMADISSRVPPELNVHLARMMIDQSSVQLQGSTDTFNTVDAIKKGLTSSVYFENVDISSANLNPAGDGVKFDIRAKRK